MHDMNVHEQVTRGYLLTYIIFFWNKLVINGLNKFVILFGSKSKFIMNIGIYILGSFK